MLRLKGLLSMTVGGSSCDTGVDIMGSPLQPDPRAPQPHPELLKILPRCGLAASWAWRALYHERKGLAWGSGVELQTQLPTHCVQTLGGAPLLPGLSPCKIRYSLLLCSSLNEMHCTHEACWSSCPFSCPNFGPDYFLSLIMVKYT